MNILFIGDIFAKPGRETVKKLLKGYRQEQNIDLVIANAENMKHGKGVTEDNINEMKAAGVDFFTSGNHIWKDKEVIPLLDNRNIPLIRPANYPAGTPGSGYRIVETPSMKRVLVINLLGRLFMPVDLDCPFRTVDNILSDTSHEQIDAIFVDFHAETTSEKYALGHYLDGRVTAVIGTHTHVPTADAQILPKGTAFQCDVGFTGPADSVIGVKKEIIIENFLTQMPVRHEIAEGPTVFNAVKVESNEDKITASGITFIQKFV